MSDAQSAPTLDFRPQLAPEFGDRYQVQRVLGRGGMGVVYEALDNELGETIAIKVLHTDPDSAGEEVERFKREIITARRITHPNVIRIHDFGVHDNVAFISMELLRGGSLADRIRAGALPLADGLQISLEAARGLHAAHEVGVVHRDIKPHNVLFDSAAPEGKRVKLADFGIARLSAVTSRTRGFSGTPHYMSPEQAEGQVATELSDIYSFGVLMFQIFTGQLPFTASSLVGLAMKHVKEAPPMPRGINPEIPKPLEDVILRALVKRPDARHPDMQTLLRNLASVIDLGVRMSPT